MNTFKINPVSKELETDLLHKINSKTKPPGSLGELEPIALKIGLIQNTLSPVLKKPHVVVFAGDNGVASEGVSAYPQEVTYQMVLNFINNGAAINVFCHQNNLGLKIVDAGVNYNFPEELPIENKKINKGTRNFACEKAMTEEEAKACLQHGANIVKELHSNGCNTIGFGEMGIGNTSAASAIMSTICQLSVEECVGLGTGLTTDGVMHKIEVIKKAIALHNPTTDPLEVLATFGGFEIGQMVGAMLQAAENKMILLVDGFISSSAYLIASKLYPNVADYALFCHQSNEKGHALLLNYLNANPLLRLNLRLGEGTGVAIAYPIIQSAINFLNNMASFESASISNKTQENI